MMLDVAAISEPPGLVAAGVVDHGIHLSETVNRLAC